MVGVVTVVGKKKLPFFFSKNMNANELVCVALVLDELAQMASAYKADTHRVRTAIQPAEYKICTGKYPNSPTDCSLYVQLVEAVRIVRDMQRTHRPSVKAICAANSMYEFYDDDEPVNDDNSKRDAWRINRVLHALSKMLKFANTWTLDTPEAMNAFKRLRLTRRECDICHCHLPPKKQARRIFKLIHDAKQDIRVIMARGYFYYDFQDDLTSLREIF